MFFLFARNLNSWGEVMHGQLGQAGQALPQDVSLPGGQHLHQVLKKSRGFTLLMFEGVLLHLTEFWYIYIIIHIYIYIDKLKYVRYISISVYMSIGSCT